MASTISYPKLNQASTVTVGTTLETLVITGLEGNGGYSCTLTPGTVTVPNSTITKGATGSGKSTISTTDSNGMKYIPIGSTITLATAGGATLVANSVVLSKTANTLTINKETGIVNSTSAGSSTIQTVLASKTAALAKLKVELIGDGTASYKIRTTIYSYDGSVIFSAADASNAVDTQSAEVSINMVNFLTNSGVVPSNNATVDLTA